VDEELFWELIDELEEAARDASMYRYSWDHDERGELAAQRRAEAVREKLKRWLDALKLPE
jgi:hypothetical protein